MSNPPKANHSNEYFNSILNQLQSIGECCECKQVLATNNNNKTSRHARRERKPHFRKCYLPSPLRMHDAKCITAEETKNHQSKNKLKTLRNCSAYSSKKFMRAADRVLHVSIMIEWNSRFLFWLFFVFFFFITRHLLVCNQSWYFCPG